MLGSVQQPVKSGPQGLGQHADHWVEVERTASHYTGRFAPTPSGPLHAGSLVAALASWLDARAHGGRWLVRIEDLDGPRCLPGADTTILAQLAALGLHSDEPPTWQSARTHLYQAALERLVARDLAYPCACSRQDVAARAALGSPTVCHGQAVYAGTCRPSNGGLRGRAPRAWRFLLAAGADSQVHWCDRRLGEQGQQVDRSVGDFVLRRADGLWAYQLAVVVDDAEQGVGDIVRGEDLADNTPRQILLQRALGVPTPRYLHTPLVRAPDGAKLSKQHGAPAVDVSGPAPAFAALREAAAVLGLAPVEALAVHEWLVASVACWRERYGL